MLCYGLSHLGANVAVSPYKYRRHHANPRGFDIFQIFLVSVPKERGDGVAQKSRVFKPFKPPAKVWKMLLVIPRRTRNNEVILTPVVVFLVPHRKGDRYTKGSKRPVKRVIVFGSFILFFARSA